MWEPGPSWEIRAGRAAGSHGGGGGVGCMYRSRGGRSKSGAYRVTRVKGISGMCARAEEGRSELGIVTRSHETRDRETFNWFKYYLDLG